MQPGCPRQEKKIAVICIVVRMMVSYEDMTQDGQRYPGPSELDRHAVPAINDVGYVVDENHLGR
jgi:hypothetical protein